MCEWRLWFIYLAAIDRATEPRISIYLYRMRECTLIVMVFSMQRQYSLIKRHYRNESTQIYRRCSTIWRLWQVQFVRWIQIQIQCTAHIHNAISTYFKLMLNAIAQKINEFDVRKKNTYTWALAWIEVKYAHTVATCGWKTQQNINRESQCIF